VYLVSPEPLRPRRELLSKIVQLGLRIEQVEGIEEVIQYADVIYITRIQKERFPDLVEYEKVKGSYKITKSVLTKGKKKSIILHPLPRADELPYDIDLLPNAAYMKQANWGVPLRMALLELVLGGSEK
jgi:aspartate carbamoyltransferase catalytic subunit